MGARFKPHSEHRFPAPSSKPSVDLFETYGVVSYGNGWRKDVVNLCLEFDSKPRFPMDVVKPKIV